MVYVAKVAHTAVEIPATATSATENRKTIRISRSTTNRGKVFARIGRGHNLNYMKSKTHFQHMMTNLRRLLPWAISAALIFMGLRMALATYVVMN